MRGFAVIVENCIFIGNIPRNYGKLLEKFDEFPSCGMRLWQVYLENCRKEISFFWFLFYVAVNMIRQIKLAFVPNYYSGNFVKFEC